MKGGYHIVDLRNANLSENAVTIPGIYDSIEGNYRKPLLLSGVVIGGLERAGVFTTATTNGSDYVFADVYGGIVTITDENVVTYTKNP